MAVTLLIDRGATPARAPVADAGATPPLAKRCPSCEQVFSGEDRFCPFDGEALVGAPDWNPASDPLLGQTVEGRYEVVAVIGEGGMGTVYEVRHATLGRRFALKVLRRDIADAEHTARFIQEAKAAAAIGHPNIVAVSDFGDLLVQTPATRGPSSAGGTVPYFVMEHLTGASLASVLRTERSVDPTRAGDIFVQCASGLAAAHAAGVIHRDLKPDNVFLTRMADREFVKLLDFGVAKMAGAGRLTRAGVVFGTPHYMSPEQAAGQSVDHRADIYALGVIMYESLSGKVPFEADTYMGVLTKHMFEAPEPLDRAVPDPARLGGLAPIAMRCLAKKPEERFASMTELGAALEAALAGMREAPASRAGAAKDRPRSVAEPDEPLSTPGLKPLLQPVHYGAGAVAALVLVVGAFLALRPAAKSASPDSSDRREGAASAATAAPPADSSTTVGAPTTAPAGSDPPVSSAPPPASAAGPTARPTGRAPVTARPAKGRKPGRGTGDVVDPWK